MSLAIRIFRLYWLILVFPMACTAQDYVKSNFDKQEVYIPMRDGKRLYTVIYTPKDHTRSYPFLMERTPYSAAPYGDSAFRGSLGPNRRLMHDGYIFVYQDVRGRYMSEGDFQ
jgi:predicted acyl esterase